MQELETMGGRSATLTKVRYTGGEAVFSREDLEDSRAIQEDCRRIVEFNSVGIRPPCRVSRGIRWSEDMIPDI